MTTPNDIFARVENGEITEYPVKLEHIQNRDHPLHWYLPVVEVSELQHDRVFFTTDATFTVKEGYVELKYAQRDKTVEELIFAFIQDGEPGLLANFTEAEIEFIKNKVIAYVEGKIEALVQERGYDSLNNLLGRYRTSTIDSYRKEAEFIQTALDNAWVTLESYFSQLITGEKRLPSSMEELDSAISIPDWSSFNVTGSEIIEDVPLPDPSLDAVISEDPSFEEAPTVEINTSQFYPQEELVPEEEITEQQQSPEEGGQS